MGKLESAALPTMLVLLQTGTCKHSEEIQHFMTGRFQTDSSPVSASSQQVPVDMLAVWERNACGLEQALLTWAAYWVHLASGSANLELVAG